MYFKMCKLANSLSSFASTIGVRLPVCIAIVSIAVVIYYMHFRRHRLVKGVPVVPRNSILGFTTPFLSTVLGDGHWSMLSLAEKYGKLFQCYFLGQHLVVVNDKTMAKDVLKSVHGKGFPFHVRKTYYIIL